MKKTKNEQTTKQRFSSAMCNKPEKKKKEKKKDIEMNDSKTNSSQQIIFHNQQPSQ